MTIGIRKALFIAPLLIAALTFAVLGQTKAVVIATNANLRGTPDGAGAVIAIVSATTTVEVYKQKGPWFLVQSPDYVGWIHGDTIRLGKPALDPSPLSELELYTPPTAPQRSTPAPRSTSPSSSRGYIRGPRGGCYYINSRGNKTYVDRSLCG